MSTSFQGTAQAFQSSLQGLGLLLIIAVVFIYIVLGILYESFVHPTHDSLGPAVGGSGRVADADAVSGPISTSIRSSA